MMSMMKQKIQKMSTESLSLVGVQRKNGNTAGTFFNMLEKVVTAKNISDSPGNIFNTEGSGIQNKLKNPTP